MFSIKSQHPLSNLVQAPLAGVSTAPFRKLTQHFMPPAYACTEMLSAKTLLTKNLDKQKRYIYKDPNEGFLCFQLAGNDAKELAEASKVAVDCGADLIDINCGCPKPKIRKKGYGSKLLEMPENLNAILAAVRKAVTVPVTLKIRLVDNFQTVITACEHNGIDALIVHGRDWQTHYETPVNLKAIQHIVSATTLPVIANGDVQDAKSAQTLLETGCAGIMIGRAAVGQPWLFQQISAELNHENFIMPSLKQRGELFLEHIHGLIDLLDAELPAILQARQLAKYYARGETWQTAFCHTVYECETLHAFTQSIARFFV